MDNFNDNGSGDQIKQGKYANAFLLFLMACVVSIASYFSYQMGQTKSESKETQDQFIKREEAQREREDKIRNEYQSKLDEREKYHENRYGYLELKIESIKDSTIAELKSDRKRSEKLTSSSRKTVKDFQGEVRKTVDVTKELDKEINSASKSLSQ